MKLLLSQQPRLQWLYCQLRHTTFSGAPKKRRLTTSPETHIHAPFPLPSGMDAISADIQNYERNVGLYPKPLTTEEQNSLLSTVGRMRKPHHLHVYSTKHNTHITLTNGDRQPIISVSAGNIGFRKAARGSYDAGFQLAAYVMLLIKQKGLLRKMDSIELTLRDFGQGREAMQKILLGTEGSSIRDKIVRVMDATRLKFGGTRSKKPRRLG